MNRIIKDKESCEILLICLYALCNYLQPVDISSKIRSYSSDPIDAFLHDICSTLCSISVFHKTYPWIILKERTRLVDGHIMGPDFMKVLNPLTRQGHEVLLDAQEYLTLYLAVIFTQEFEVGKESSGNGVLDCHYGGISLPLIHPLIQVLE